MLGALCWSELCWAGMAGKLKKKTTQEHPEELEETEPLPAGHW